MHEWIKKNHVKVVYGLALLSLILLVALYSTHDTSSKEITRLQRINAGLDADSAAKDKVIEDDRNRYDELSQNLEASKAETAKLNEEIKQLGTANGELAGNVKSLEASLADAKFEIDRIDFVALLRKNNVEKLRNEVALLKRAESDAKFEIDRIDFVALLRKNNVEKLRNEVALLNSDKAQAATE
ncbi:MAG: hypothetical protein FWE55_02385, partial [Synergistaceae bacterium]|nr:hypothetical protein [Synergistaceae bacterium]